MRKKQIQGASGLNVGFGKFKDKLLVDLAKEDLESFKQIKELYYDKYDSTKQKYYKSLEKKYIVEKGLTNTAPDQALIVDEAVFLMKQRWVGNQIRTLFSEKYNLDRLQINSIMSDANTLIRREFESEKSLLLDLHLLRYEEIYLENISIDLEEVPAGYRKALKCEHTITAMETLFQKERLLGVHTKTFKIKANESVLQNKTVEFDITILNSNERLEILGLLNKAKAVEVYNKPFVTNNNPLNIDIKANKVEVVITDAPIKASTQTDTIGDEQSTLSQDSGKSFLEVKESLSNSLADKVKELFEKKKKS